MVDGVEQTSLNSIFFPAWFLLNVALHYQGEAQRSYNWKLCGGGSKKIYTHIIAVESIYRIMI